MIARWVRNGIALAIGLVLTGGAYGPGATAQVPRVVSYQGVLGAGEAPSPDRVTLTFAFYPTEAPRPDEAPVEGWQETHAAVPVDDGRFSVLIGSRTDLPEGLFARDDVYLQVTVDGEAMPRLRMASTPFALHAGQAEVARRVRPQSVDADALADGAVARAKIESAAVGSDQLAPAAVTTEKLAQDAVTTEKIVQDAVTTEKIAYRAVTEQKIANGTVVRSLGSAGGPTLSGHVALRAGDNVDLDVDPDDRVITISATGWFRSTQRSARRFKEDIETLEDPVALVKALRGVRYRWKESGAADVGVIAEEVAEVLPELVEFEEDGRARGVHYAKLTAVLVEALKAQQEELDAAHRRLGALEDRIARMEAFLPPDAPAE